MWVVVTGTYRSPDVGALVGATVHQMDIVREPDCRIQGDANAAPVTAGL